MDTNNQIKRITLDDYEEGSWTPKFKKFTSRW